MTGAIGTEAEAFWEAFYRGGRSWSGEPNPLLVGQAEDLVPGTALDVGCGQGGDAIWLGAQGWRVTATDVSAVALAAAAEHAEAAGVAGAIEWQRHDLAVTFPAGSFDLVSACYLHAPIPLDRARILRSAAGAVAPGGTLVIVGHAGVPSWKAHHDHAGAQLPTRDEVLADLALAGDGWEVIRSEDVTWSRPGADGEPMTRTDNVLRIGRRG